MTNSWSIFCYFILRAL